MSYRIKQANLSRNEKAERRRIKAKGFLYTALGISLWLCLLSTVSPRLTGSSWLGRKLLSASTKCPHFDQWIHNGGVVLYFVGILYLFLGISIACDEFFVGSLKAISTKLNLSEDVAGATFMAAGSSAPELFASLVALTNDEAANDIGIGTIVGSAIFNILIIIGVTAVFSGNTLDLDYRPLVRDATFYAASIVGVIFFFYDGKIHWWEGLVSVLLYGVYVVALKYNSQILKRFSSRRGTTKVASSEQTSQKSLTSTHGDAEAPVQEVENGDLTRDHAIGNGDPTGDHAAASDIASTSSPPRPSRRGENGFVANSNDDGEEEKFIFWVIPKCSGNRVAWGLSVPWYIALGFTIPRCESESWRQWYLATFFSSVLWIGLISWFMVEWAGDIGCILGIPSAIMGVTVLAAGTSIPDALSSIVVAREGSGDMAVANAVGSNVFDIWLGLGIPWLFVIPFKNNGEDNQGTYIEVDDGELLPNVLILFGVLVFYLASVVVFDRKLYPTTGYIFIALYGVYAIYNVVAVWQLDIYNADDD